MKKRQQTQARQQAQEHARQQTRMSSLRDKKYVEKARRAKRVEKGIDESHIRERGFTLIEILVVIGIIAVLAAVVLVAVNPSRQFKLARDSQRVSNVESILNAVGQNIAEHKGLFTCPNVTTGTTTITSSSTVIKNDANSIGGVDLAPCLVPAYISSLPFDPASPSFFYASTSNYDTGYSISEDDDGRITISANGEISTDRIQVTR